MSTFRRAWFRYSKRHANNSFLFDDGQFRSYRDIHADVTCIARGLQDIGVTLGTFVLVGMKNRPEFVLVHLAIQWLGGVTVPLQSSATFDELEFVINHSQGQYLVADNEVWIKLGSRLSELPKMQRIVLLDEAVDQLSPANSCRLDVLRSRGPLPFPELDGYDDLSPAMVLYTSGSSGRPKGVVIPAGAPTSVASGLIERLGLTSGDNIFIPTPMAHAVGVLTGLSAAVVTGGRLTLAPSFSPRTFWRFVQRTGATVCCLFPAHLNLLMKTEASAPAYGETTLHTIFTHAWHTPFIQRFGISLRLCWGMTETGAMMAMTQQGEDGGSLRHYVGKPMIGTEIVAMGSDCNPLPPGVVGELCLRHRHIMLGYLHDPDATHDVCINGWIHSGDIGSVDELGRVFYQGRMKNVIKRSGENISAEEVEEKLENLAEVSECCVFGTSDPVRTEEVVACVTVVRKRSCDVSPESIIVKLQESISRWKLPRYIVLSSDSLPHLVNGKVDRKKLESTFQAGFAWDRYEYERQLRLNQFANPENKGQ